MSGNGSGFTAGNPNAPDGTQVAFLQGTGSMSQSVYLNAGTLQPFVPGRPARRSGQSHYQEIQVLVDGDAGGPGHSRQHQYGSYQTPSFTVAAGLHTIEVRGPEPAGRRQHGLRRRDGDLAGGELDQRRQLRGAGAGREDLPVRPQRLALAVLRSGRREQQRQRLHRGQSQRPDGSQVAFLQGTGSMSQSVYLNAGSYSVSFQAAQRAAGQTDTTRRFRCWSTARRWALVTPASTSTACTRRRISR